MSFKKKKLGFYYCQLNYPADRIWNPVFDNKYGSLKLYQEAFVDCQLYMSIGTFKGSPEQFPGQVKIILTFLKNSFLFLDILR